MQLLNVATVNQLSVDQLESNLQKTIIIIIIMLVYYATTNRNAVQIKYQ